LAPRAAPSLTRQERDAEHPADGAWIELAIITATIGI
jgi:hypothetical protein